jgi:hypothetical protein
MSCGKGVLAAASASADRDALSGRPSSVRNRDLCRRGIAMPPRPTGVDEFLHERSNSTSMCTHIVSPVEIAIYSVRCSLYPAVLIAVFIGYTGTTLADPLLTYPLRIKNHEIRAEVANTEEGRRRGLMFRDRLGDDSGMVFSYLEAGVNAMWMKNTRIPLSVAFIDRNGRILNIEDMEPFSEQAHASAGEAAYALEMSRGWFSKRGIKGGDRVEGLQRLPPPQ